MLLFCYPFILILAAEIILAIKSGWIRNTLITLMGCFILLNILSIAIIPLNPLDNESPFPLVNWDTTREIDAAEWHGLSDEPALASGPMTSLLQYYQGTNARQVSNLIDYFEVEPAVWLGGSAVTTKFAWLMVSPEDPAFVRRAGFMNIAVRLSENSLRRLPETPWLEKVYTNGKWDTYRIVQMASDNPG